MASEVRPESGVSLVMQPKSGPNLPAHDDVTDCATLYLCRQGTRWVVVIESPGLTTAVEFQHAGSDTYDAQFDLLTIARRACPDAAIMSTDGARTLTAYEWRVEVRGVEMRLGDLGAALHRALSAEPMHAPDGVAQAFGRRCHWGLAPSFSGRPRNF